MKISKGPKFFKKKKIKKGRMSERRHGSFVQEIGVDWRGAKQTVLETPLSTMELLSQKLAAVAMLEPSTATALLEQMSKGGASDAELQKFVDEYKII